ncbi:lariat debranching enzyme [Pimephales promelas]|uniref:lariat debranching enzyme n=1 Tax=Pimephales promelas TaxID=90988 RepID=UPI001955A584|nr:lariat debranching enzyme [Pimephales promelas]KAG1946023.1 lariat debranching enzyme [Pimephales promelas]
MKVAVEGCCHGELDKIYESISYLENKEGVKVDLLLCCGDFQAVRNEGDMKCMAVPAKYRQMQTFYKYYSGEKKAPVLTIFIGGNHEASNYLQELPYGGWVAPNIYYLGYAGVVRFRGVRIGGLSGIFKSHDYKKGHFEFPPYNQETLRSVYHIRNIDVFKLKQLKMPIDIFVTHDWPRGIYHYGNTNQLLRKKKFLRQEVESGTLGSPAAAELLDHLQPSYWFSAHLHVKFAALMQHEAKNNSAAKITKFLSLDKCLPHRDFLQIVEVADRPGSSEHLEYDPEWLAILKATDRLQKPSHKFWNPPQDNGLHTRWDFSASEEAMMEVVRDLSGDLCIPQNFSLTVPAYDPSHPQPNAHPAYSTNPQTTEVCATLGLTDIYILAGQHGQTYGEEGATEEEEDEDSTGSVDEPSEYPTDTSGLSSSYNPDEITIEDEWEEEEDEAVACAEEKGTDAVVPEGQVGGQDSDRDSSPQRETAIGLILPPPCAAPEPEAPLHSLRPLSLPPPSASLSQGSSEEEGGFTSARVPKRTSGETAQGPASHTGGTPQIKRRNQSIYTAVDDEESEG